MRRRCAPAAWLAAYLLLGVAVAVQAAAPSRRKAPAATPPPACGAVYKTISDDYGYDYASDFTLVVCGKMKGAKNSALRNALNPTLVKTVGAPTVKLLGMPLVGGSYTASFVPKKSKKIYLPEPDDIEYIVATEDYDYAIMGLCDAVLKEAGFLLPFGMHSVGSTKVMSSGSVVTKCQTKWGAPELAALPPAELQARVDSWYEEHPTVKRPVGVYASELGPPEAEAAAAAEWEPAESEFDAPLAPGDAAPRPAVAPGDAGARRLLRINAAAAAAAALLE
ncbi:MAG: hypothetical protein J3K34DRAFT_417670 [Monoraphidium minutum]|nr:MAG: hypothetical protein J3K34DRAFT_417670 [Monoraphidium minutum]